MSQKNQIRKKLELGQNDVIFTKIFELCQVLKCSNTLELYILKALLGENWFYFFFLIF